MTYDLSIRGFKSVAKSSKRDFLSLELNQEIAAKKSNLIKKITKLSERAAGRIIKKANNPPV